MCCTADLDAYRDIENGVRNIMERVLREGDGGEREDIFTAIPIRDNCCKGN